MIPILFLFPQLLPLIFRIFKDPINLFIVIGARIYYMASIMHDYNDALCTKILRNLVPVMTPNYSSIVIVDLVLPERNAPWFAAMVDLTLMACLTAKERTRKEFEKLVEGAGLRVLKVYHSGIVGSESALEVVLKDDVRV